MVEDNAVDANDNDDDDDDDDDIHGDENPNNHQGVHAAAAAHEIPTSDHEDQSSSSSFPHNNSDYAHDPNHRHQLMNPIDNMHHMGGPAFSSPPSFYSHPHFPPPPPMILPPIPPPPESSGSSSNEQQLDFTRQYYEARMREHAMQYANAAAGAAWAAARMASSFSMQHTNNGGSYVPANGSTNNDMLMMNNMMHPSQFHPEYHQLYDPQSQQPPPQQQRRKLWKPPKQQQDNKSKKSKNYENTTTAEESGERIMKQPSKKRDSGNDSVSSLGSSNNNRQHNARFKKKKGKKNQRRRFNDDNDHDESIAAATSSGSTDYHRHDGNDSDVYNCKQCHKRGLQHQQQHTSKSSFSSMGSSGAPTNNNNNNGNRKKKKNRSSNSSSNNSNSMNNHSIQGIFLGGLIGKTAVSALHELCHKYRWEKPVYTLIENVGGGNGGSSNASNGGGEGADETNDTTSNSASNRSNNNNNHHPHEFVLAVHVNKIELGRGRGDSKTAAKQDGSRKALAALVPGVVFDPNGILLDVGGGGGGGAGRSGGGGGGRRGNGDHGRLIQSSSITSMEELGPHLASQLAIGGGDTAENAVGVQHLLRSSRPSSPDHSETSSISTSVSMTKMTRVGSISGIIDNVGIGEVGGGVLSVGGGPVVGIIGARSSSGNIYPCASTTSGVSSASEVEDGEDENAYYASRGASVCSTLLQAMWQIDDRIRQPPSYSFDVSPITAAAAAKESSGIEQPNKRRKSGGGPSSERKKPAAHRGTFQCTATLNLYFRMDEEGKEYSPSSLMESWESPLEYLQTRDKTFSSSYYGNVVSSQQESRKRKDSFASQATPSPDRRLLKGSSLNDDEPDNSASKRQKLDEFMKHTLESKATGVTKRESKHKASAKLLTLLFPECSSLVEVKAAAEAARECYAATKAMTSQTKRAKLSDKASPERRGLTASERSGDLLAKSDSFVSVAGLSLSEEPVEESKRIKWCDSAKTDSIAGLEDASFECEVDTALKCLRDQEEEPSDDVGRIVLCRAQPDDAEFIYALLNKAYESKCSGEVVNVHAAEDVTNSIYGSDSIFLLLSRAVSSHEPLGCAILTLVSSSVEGGRSLVLQNIGHEEHLPRERFIECLEAFASKLDTNLDTSSIFNDVRLISPDEIRKCLIQSNKPNNSTSSPSSYQGEEVIGMNMKGNSSHSLLQSVKEEDSEDADDGSDGDNIIMEKEVGKAHHDPEVGGKRPLRSKRRRVPMEGERYTINKSTKSSVG